MPAGEVSALLQLDVNSVAFYFLIHIFSESRKKKNRLAVRAHVGGWHAQLFPACRRGCGPRSRNHRGGRNRARAASSAWLQSQLGNARAQRGFVPRLRWARLRWPPSPCGGGRRCVQTRSTACWVSRLAAGGWEWLRGHSFPVASSGDHADCTVFWPLVNIDSLF